MEYNYIIREREFFKANQNVYKIGKTKQAFRNRVGDYPKGSEIINTTSVKDCDLIETILISEFKKKFIHRNDIGNEYFEGDPKEMSTLLITISLNPSSFIVKTTNISKKVDNTNHRIEKYIKKQSLKNEIPPLFNKDDPSDFNQIHLLVSNEDITIAKIVIFLIKTCAFISNGGDSYLITKTFDEHDDIVYNKINKLSIIKFQMNKKNKNLNDVIEKYKKYIIFTKCVTNKYENNEEFKKMYDKRIFNDWIKKEDFSKYKNDTYSELPIQFIKDLINGDYSIIKHFDNSHEILWVATSSIKLDIS